MQDRSVIEPGKERNAGPAVTMFSPVGGAWAGSRRSDLQGYGVALGAIAVALATAFLVAPYTGVGKINLVFLAFVIAVAIRYGTGPSLVASVLAVFAEGFFFMEPLQSFEIADLSNVIALIFFMAVALVTSHLATRARNESITARRRADESAALYGLSRQLSELTDVNGLLEATRHYVASLLSLDAVLILRGRDDEILQQVPDERAAPINSVDRAAIQAGWSRDLENREALRIGGRLFFPLRSSNGVLGFIGVLPDRREHPLSREERQLLAALSDQATIAIERVLLAAERDEALMASERERLRSTLFASLSHDLKTPLASITGAITSLRQYGNLYDHTAREDLAAMIQDEAERLSRFVGNLLDMARLEAGGVSPNLQPVDLSDMIGTALQRMDHMLVQVRAIVTIDADLPMLVLDPVLFEQVMVNLLDNAAKYAPAGSTISLEARRRADGVVLTVSDEGPGIAEEDLGRVFEKFFRSDDGDRQRSGTGLGLAICRGFVTAMGGSITADNRPPSSRGAAFTITFPGTLISTAPAAEDFPT